MSFAAVTSSGEADNLSSHNAGNLDGLPGSEDGSLGLVGPLLDNAGDAAREGFLAPLPGAGLAGRGRQVVLRGTRSAPGDPDWPAPEDWTGPARPDPGAHRDGRLIGGPAFAHRPNPLYRERPRIVATARGPGGLVATFSVAIRATGPLVATVERPQGALDVAVRIDGRHLVVPVAGGAPGSRVVLPSGLVAAADGMPATFWAASDPLLAPGA